MKKKTCNYYFGGFISFAQFFFTINTSYLYIFKPLLYSHEYFSCWKLTMRCPTRVYGQAQRAPLAQCLSLLTTGTWTQAALPPLVAVTTHFIPSASSTTNCKTDCK